MTDAAIDVGVSGRYFVVRAEQRYANAPPEPTAQIYRLDADLSCHPMVTGIGETNTFGMSPDDRTMYLVTPPGGSHLCRLTGILRRHV